VLVDRSHSRWLVVAASLTLVSTGLCVLYARTSPNGPSGGTWQGMLFGVAASACMVYAGMFSGRKAVPGWRVGTAQTWLRGHLWIGLLSVPLILCHCGLRWGGLLEQCLLLVFALVIASGVFGLVMQQSLPNSLTQAVPAQAIAAQVDVACQRLRGAVERTVQKVCGPTFLAALESPPPGDYSPELEFAKFYWDHVADYLAPGDVRGSMLFNAAIAETQWARLRDALPESFWPALDSVQDACRERRQLHSQSRIQHWLHGWLLLHIPLSVALLILGLLHAVTAVYY
jgi:hypothetical protein